MRKNNASLDFMELYGTLLYFTTQIKENWFPLSFSLTHSFSNIYKQKPLTSVNLLVMTCGFI